MITVQEFTRAYPEKTCMEHFRAVRAALKAGKPVPSNVLNSYPALQGEGKK